MAAKTEGAVLVINEKRLPNKAAKVGVATITTEQMLAEIGFMVPQAAPDSAT
jgi:hypothetical protein